MKLIPVLLSVAFVAAVCALADRDETPDDENQAVENPESSMTVRPQKRVFGAIVGAVSAAAGLIGTGASIWFNLPWLGRAVAVKNHLGYSIQLRCQSGDDDLGWKTLQDGEAFMFQFGAHIFGRSHFWCTASGNQVWAAFPVYNEGAPTWQKNVYNLLPSGIYHTDNLDSDKGSWFRGWN